MDSPPTRLLAGYIGKPHGLQGEVYVTVISDDPDRFEPGSLLLGPGDENLEIADVRRHRDRLLVRFAGVENRDEAEKLRGLSLYVTTGDLRALEDDEFWPHDLIGCAVLTTSGEAIGRTVEVVAGAAQDLLRVDTASGSKLIPMAKDIVVDVDVAARRIVVNPPEGLLD